MKFKVIYNDLPSHDTIPFSALPIISAFRWVGDLQRPEYVMFKIATNQYLTLTPRLRNSNGEIVTLSSVELKDPVVVVSIDQIVCHDLQLHKEDSK